MHQGSQETGFVQSATGDLLRSLVPRAQSFSVFDVAGNCVWASDGVDDNELDEFVGDLPGDAFRDGSAEEGYVRRTLSSGRTVLALPIAAEGGIQRGLLVVLFSRNEGKSSAFNPSLIHGILKPAVQTMADSDRLAIEQKRAVQQQELLLSELRLVYEVDERVHGSSRSHSGLAHLVGRSGRFLKIAYSVLLIPGKRIRISATHSSWKGVNRRVLDRYLIDHMMPKLDGRQHPVVFEIPPMADAGGASAQGYQTLVCPIVDRHGTVEGILAQLGRVDGEPFEDSHRSLMAHIARKVEYVVEQSYDAMTGLMNRRGFEAQLAESLKDLGEDVDRHQLLYLDLDNLALVNDRFGRDAGDEVVRRFASMISEDLPTTAVQSRYTGDDFCILLTKAGEDDAVTLAESIRTRCEKLRYLEGDTSLQITTSIGIAEFSNASDDVGQVLTSARLACEAAKEHGRNRIEVYDLNNQSMIRRYDDMNLVAEVQRNLDNDGFTLMAQPIVRLDEPGGEPRYEVLLRMRDNDDESVPTASFFSAAERYQLMPQIDRWVVSNTLRIIAEHRDEIEALGATFSINLSGQSLSDDNMLKFVLDEIDAANIPAAMLGFEVTESAAVANLKKAQRFIDELHRVGCHISLDDFGAGLSSFAYLKNFRVDTLKIDGSFVRDIVDNRISESMVAAITEVARVMELETVAEYVESEEIQELVQRLGVTCAQGHYVGKPEPLETVATAEPSPAVSAQN